MSNNEHLRRGDCEGIERELIEVVEAMKLLQYSDAEIDAFIALKVNKLSFKGEKFIEDLKQTLGKTHAYNQRMQDFLLLWFPASSFFVRSRINQAFVH
jgi:hypothetical protein